MALERYIFPTDQAAADALRADGWSERDGAAFGPYWVKPSHVENWYGRRPALALVAVERRDVAPEYGGEAFYEIRFL